MNRLRDLREDNDWTLAYVATKIGATAAAVSRYEKEQRTLTPETIAAFCRLYGVTADYLLGFSLWKTPNVSKLDTTILAAYHAAPAEVKKNNSCRSCALSAA